MKYLSKSINEDNLNRVIYIDTEGTFHLQRVNQLARARSLNGIEIIRNITLLECYTLITVLNISVVNQFVFLHYVK
jgi:Rad51